MSGDATFRVLGPLAVDDGTELRPVPGGHRHDLLAALLCFGDAGVAADDLAELLAGDPSAPAASTVRSNVTRLRRFLAEHVPSAVIELRPQGYVLDPGDAAVDRVEFEARLARAREAAATGDRSRAADEAGAALGLWRGPAFGAAGERLLLLAEVTRLEELRALALEIRAAALLEVGRSTEVVGELQPAVAAHPLREELRRLLILALARADRQVEALRVYEDYRRVLAELGAEPSPRLRELDRRVATGDPSLLGPRPGAGPGRWPLPPEVTATTPLVAREGEVARLAAALDWALAGTQGLVVVEGEAGVGKSHLVAALAETAQQRGAIVLAGACDETLRTPYGPFARALRFFREQGGAWADDQLTPWWDELARLLPEIRPEGAGSADRAAGPPTDPQTELLRLLDALAGWLGALAATTPVVLVLEDLHWAPDPTLLALRRLALPGGLDHLLVLATVRNPELGRPPLLDEVLGAARRTGVLVDELDLAGLDVAGVGRLIDSLRADLDGDDAFVATVAELTAGNPLFVGELVVDLASPALPGDRVALPSAGDLVARRLRQVDAEVAGVLAEAAVIGTDVSLDLLVDVSSESPEVVLAALDEAIEAGLLQVVPDPRQRLRFTHAVVRDALLTRLGRATAVDIHRRVAAALLALPPAARAPHVEALARHAYEASVVEGPAAAVGLLVDAADAALAQRAYRHAAEWYGRALELAERAGVAEAGRFELLAAKGDAQRRAGDDGYRTSILTAAELAREAGDGDGLARAALVGSRGFFRQTGEPDLDWLALLEEAVAVAADAPPASRALLLASYASELVWSDPEGRRFALADEALDQARLAGEPTVLSQVLVLRLTTIWSPEHLDLCREAAAEALVATRAAGDQALHCHALRFAAGAAVEAGDREEADRLLARAEAATDEVAQPDLQWHLTLARAAWAVADGDLEVAEALAARSLALGMAADQPEALPFFGMVNLEVLRYRGLLPVVIDEVMQRGQEMFEDLTFALHRFLAAGGRDDEARPAYEARVADLDGIVLGLATMPAIANLAWLAVHFGDATAAAGLYERWVPYADRLAQGILTLPVGHHHLGVLAATAGFDHRVEGHLAAAVDFHHRAGMPLHEAESRLAWARWSAGQGTDGVDQHLAVVREVADRHGAALLAAEADALT